MNIFHVQGLSKIYVNNNENQDMKVCDIIYALSNIIIIYHDFL